MFSRRTPRFCGKMKGPATWLTALIIHSVLATSLAYHHRRSMAAPTILPVSKGGWRPVVGSGSLPAFAPFPAAPLHAPPTYKIPIPVEPYPSSSRPISARDAAKNTPGALQYRPTTIRTHLQSQSPSPNQPINTYLNPFGLQNGLSHYKIVQNFPMESVVIRNPHNPYIARPAFAKYPLKYKQHGTMQQLNNIQALQFSLPYQNKPHEVFSKPVEVYVRPSDSKKPQTFKDPNAPEIFKPEVYKLDSDPAPQSVAQQVKTAQQQQNFAGNSKPAQNHFQQYPFKDDKFAPLPPNIGTYNPFATQSVKGRNPAFPMKQTTYVPPSPTKQTVFNSFSYTPTFKTSANPYFSTTPKLQTTLQHNYNHLLYGQLNEYKVPPTQQVKYSTPYKTESGAPNKGGFKASPQDPFSKNSQHQLGHKQQGSHANKHHQVTTYTPSPSTTTQVSSYFSDFSGRLPAQSPSQNPPFTSYYNQNHDKKKYVHPDSFASSVNHPPSSQYPSPPKKQEFEATPNIVPFRATYDVTELYGEDIITHSSPNSWSAAPDYHNTQYNTQQRPTSQEVATKSVFTEVTNPNLYTKPTTAATNLPEEYEIVTESYGNNLQYDSHLETQSRRPLGDDFEPIGKHKLKDYYYRVSTPAQTEYTTAYKRIKSRPTEATVKPTEAYGQNFEPNKDKENIQSDALPTLPPSLHFKRPTGQDNVDKDKIRKRNKIRRRRPPQATRVTEKEETSTRKYVSPSTDFFTTEADEVHTYRPRPRLPSYNQKAKSTTPSITTDLSTSALPTVTPTTPTTNNVKKIRRPTTTTTPADRFETTTISYKESELNKESTIMKIASRDYSHKQDEKDTPTSDISVSLTETTSRSRLEPMKFSFHRDVKPLDSKPELLVKGVEKSNNEVKETTSNYLADTTNKNINEEDEEIDTTTIKQETTDKVIRPRLKNKYDTNRPRFSVKDYRNRLSSTTTTEKSNEPHMPKLRFPQRRLPSHDNRNNSDDNSTDISRKKFTPKDPRYKGDEKPDPTTERDVQARNVHRQRSTTEAAELPQKISSRVRGGQRRPTKPAEETTESVSSTTQKRNSIRKKVKDTELSETVQDVSVTESTDKKEDIEKKKSESAIMKIAKEEKKHSDIDLYEHSKRVSDLTLAASKDYNTPGMFKTVSPNSRRVPSYFTIATDDPILPIEAFFPQLNQKKET